MPQILLLLYQLCTINIFQSNIIARNLHITVRLVGEISNTAIMNCMEGTVRVGTAAEMKPRSMIYEIYSLHVILNREWSSPKSGLKNWKLLNYIC